MTVPEENRPKTASTDDVLTDKEAVETDTPGTVGTGRTVKEAFEEAGVTPEDFEEK
ncbi:hypothetical protein [Streptomyces rishiriensis]|uniref:Uncharacterized protein n=1 Tax=Streptomyces rishiriensis TaxID=68264 RepID=A0ABU0P2U4_STRRH|nr:hypothetical protein [Streptomyces rishiriensis]MDQ0585722.1 hypothetical protein [Streptomyces rishiriensis]